MLHRVGRRQPVAIQAKNPVYVPHMIFLVRVSVIPFSKAAPMSEKK